MASTASPSNGRELAHECGLPMIGVQTNSQGRILHGTMSPDALWLYDPSGFATERLERGA